MMLLFVRRACVRGDVGVGVIRIDRIALLDCEDNDHDQKDGKERKKQPTDVPVWFSGAIFTGSLTFFRRFIFMGTFKAEASFTTLFLFFFSVVTSNTTIWFLVIQKTTSKIMTN